MPVKQTTTTYQGGTPIRWSADQVAEVARAVAFGVPVGFIVGMAKRESGWKINQIDLDYDKETGEPMYGKETYGLCMVRKSEALQALSLTAIDTDGLLDPATNIKVLCTALARQRGILERAASGSYTEDDMLRYLCWSHNAGVGQPLKSIQTYGLDWAATVQRNTLNPGNGYMRDRMIPYAEEVLSYVNRYTSIDVSTGEVTREQGAGSDDTFLRVLFLLVGGWAGWTYLLGKGSV